MREIWKQVKGYEGYYEVSSIGNVRSVDRMVNGRQLRGHDISRIGKPNGYEYVCLNRDGRKKSMYVHRLVAEAFCEHEDGCDYVDHINYDRTDNRAENLRWVTQAANVRHSKPNARPYVGLRRPEKAVRGVSGHRYIHKTKKGAYRVFLNLQGDVICREFQKLSDALTFREGMLCTLEKLHYPHSSGD